MGLLLLMGGASRPRGILDSFSGAAGAYSVRRLRQNYNGAGLRVRRDSDNAETDVSFLENGNLDTSSLTSFCGAGNGFVTTWYDQTTNGKNAVQATTTNQPQIVSSGSLITEGGRAALEFDGSNDGFVTGITELTIGTSASFFHVVKTNDTAGVLYWANNAGRWVWILQSGSSSTALSDKFTISSVYKNGSLQSLTNRGQYYTAFGDNVRHLGTLLGTIATENWTDLGLFNYTGFSLGGRCQEIIIYANDQSSSRSGIESNINTYFGIY